MADNPDRFVINRLRSKPVSYTVRIEHLVINGEWNMGFSVHDVIGDIENRHRVAADLRRAADMLDDQENETVPK